MFPQQTPGWQVEIGVGSGVIAPLMVAETSTRLTVGSETDEAAEADAEVHPSPGIDTSTKSPN